MQLDSVCEFTELQGPKWRRAQCGGLLGLGRAKFPLEMELS